MTDAYAEQVRQQLADTRAELAALHAGEEPYEDERAVPTPGQWVWRWNRGTTEQRLVWAEHVVAAISDAHTCKVLAFHEQRIAEYSADRQEDVARALSAEAERDGAYRERAQLLAWLASLHPAVLAPAPDVDEPGWQILYLTAGGQQLSWHIHPRDSDLYGHVEQVTAGDPRAQWDGHTTAEKYQRIAGLAQQRPGCPDPVECGHEAALGQAEARIAAARALANDLATWLAPDGVTAASVRVSLIAALGGPAEQPADQLAEWRDTVPAGREIEQQAASELHASRAHPGWEYATTEGPRKQWYDAGTPPYDDNGDPDPSWERNVDAGRDGWERFDYTEESYWRRPVRADGAS